MNKRAKPLYRKINWKTRNVHRNSPTGDYKHERNTKKMKRFKGMFKSMPKRNHGYDYTPLYKFLLSKIGEKWDDVYSEVVKRVNDTEPIFYIVDKNYKEGNPEIVTIGESSYYSKLKIEEGILVKINPKAIPNKPSCKCCTHTFNGKVFNNGKNYLHDNKIY